MAITGASRAWRGGGVGWAQTCGPRSPRRRRAVDAGPRGARRHGLRGRDRYLAGVLAERRLGATVHLLDDGFQHFALARDLDVLVTTPGEIPRGRVLPRGRLREPGDAAARAHVLVVMGATAGAAASEAWTLGDLAEACWRCLVGSGRSLGRIGSSAAGARAAAGSRHLESGIPIETGSLHRLRRAPVSWSQRHRQPAALCRRCAGSGLDGGGGAWFADHHPFSARDIAAHRGRGAAERGAEAVFTTDKDAVRLEDIDVALPAVSRADDARVRSADGAVRSAWRRACGRRQTGNRQTRRSGGRPVTGSDAGCRPEARRETRHRVRGRWLRCEPWCACCRTP